MSFHLDFEHKACVHSHLLCCVHSQYHLALTIHRCSLTQGPFMFHQDLQRSADCINFLISLPISSSSALPPDSVCPYLLSCCTPWSAQTRAWLPVPCPRSKGIFARTLVHMEHLSAFPLFIYYDLGEEKLFVGEKVTSFLPGRGERGRNN